MKAAVSVFIPVYNAADYLDDTIKSVLAQTYQNWELLIIDDCSTDNSYDIARRYSEAHPRITVIRNAYNLGMLENWNKGIGLCSHPYFVKLDADDLWNPSFLEKSLQILKQYPDVGLVFTKYTLINPEGEQIPGTQWDLPEFAFERPFSCINLVNLGPKDMLSYPILRQGLSLMKRSIFDQIGTYKYLLSRETLAATDTEFYFRLGAHFKIYCINEDLYRYRIHTNSISRRNESDGLGALKMYEIRISIFDYYFKNGFLDYKKYRLFIRQSKDIYLPYLINSARKKREFKKSIMLFTDMALHSPLFTLRFYLKRILTKHGVT